MTVPNLGLPLAVSSAGWAVIGSLLGAVIGGVIGWAASRSQWFLERSERRRDERRNVYAEFLTAVVDVTHRLFSFANSEYALAEPNAAELKESFDRDVTPRFRILELVGSDDAVGAAEKLHTELRRFRDALTVESMVGDLRPAYDSAEFRSLHRRVYHARNEFQKVARKELVGTDGEGRASDHPETAA